ncbi:hypothetical protein ADIS_4840 [Lunatimonas lonarensis]|uniref:Uncharacterized protein n=1 Tax=Lunatimonas lonarensis TaxID=1232681 RepID=R7ZL23_9BACT|nr:hypothetical protein ADIS_4840 [Lunatimonas lonarensis]
MDIHFWRQFSQKHYRGLCLGLDRIRNFKSEIEPIAQKGMKIPMTWHW